MKTLKRNIFLRKRVLLAFLLPFACNPVQINDNTGKSLEEVKGPYLGQIPPDTIPKIFAPGIVSTALPERDLTISPDGNEIYFTVQLGKSNDWRSSIVCVKQVNGVWSKPEVAPFSGRYSDIEPFIQPDGQRLYFASRRPLIEGEENEYRYSIWYVSKKENGWSEAKPIGEPINGDGMVCYATIAKSGTMYFTKMHKDGSEFIYRSAHVDGQFTKPEMLSKAININKSQWNACISPDEDFLIVPSVVENDNYGSADYYVSFRDKNDNWSELINLGDKINTPGLEFTPALSPDGKYFFFQRMAWTENLNNRKLNYNDLVNIHNGRGDIYWVDASIIRKLNPYK